MGLRPRFAQTVEMIGNTELSHYLNLEGAVHFDPDS